MYVVISGGGKVGEYLAGVLLSSGNEVAIIERDPEIADRLSMLLQGRYMSIRGDGCDSRYQEDAGIRKADVFVATTGQDDNNLVSCEIAQRVFNVPRCIARVNSPQNLRIFRALNIEAISSTELTASLIEEEALLGSVSVVSTLTHGNVVLISVTLQRFRNNDQKEGVSVDDVPIPEGSLIVAVEGSDGVSVVTEKTRLYPNDKAIVVAESSILDEVRAAFRML